MSHTVGEVAKLAHVTVRTLHHYDRMGLLSPSERSEAGYRRYSLTDLELLQQVLFYRELGFRLHEIKNLMRDGGIDRCEALLGQRDLLEMRVARLQAMVGLIDRTLVSLEGGIAMGKEEMFEVFRDFDPSQYEEEAKERWGEMDAYRESAKRTSGYTKDDWQRIKMEGEGHLKTMVTLLDQGVPPNDPRAMDVAEEARLALDRNFYPCSHEMHVGLGEMYVADPRFASYYDQHRPGLAQWFCDAIKANAERAATR